MASLHEAKSEYVPEDVESAAAHDSSRDIRVSVATNASAFEVVEKTTWNEGTWSDTTLIVDGSDVSGILRFMGPPPRGSKNSEFFLVAVGYDTAAWCDLKVNLRATETGALIHRRYYDETADEYKIKQQHPTTATGTLNSGTKITVTVAVTENGPVVVVVAAN